MSEAGDMEGFSLVEVIVALLILEVGLLGVAGLSLLSARQLGSAARTERMLTVAEEVLDSLAFVVSPESGRRASSLGRVQWEIGDDGDGRAIPVVLSGVDDHGRRLFTLWTLLALPSGLIETPGGGGAAR